MTIRYRPARPEDCDRIADMVRELAADTGGYTVPKVTGDQLRQHGFSVPPLLSLTVAEAEDRLVGALIGSTIFSTWRGMLGLYVVDLYVDPDWRGRQIGESLMRRAAMDAQAAGLGFMKLEISPGNEGAERFYRRLGFQPVEGDRNFVLTGAGFEDLAQ